MFGDSCGVCDSTLPELCRPFWICRQGTDPAQTAVVVGSATSPWMDRYAEAIPRLFSLAGVVVGPVCMEEW